MGLAHFGELKRNEIAGRSYEVKINKLLVKNARETSSHVRASLKQLWNNSEQGNQTSTVLRALTIIGSKAIRGMLILPADTE